MRWLVSISLVACLLFATRSAQAQDYFNSNDSTIQFKVDRERSKKNKIVLASLAGSAVLFGGIGGLFALHSRSQSDKVSRVGMHSGLVWTQDRADTRSSALRSRTLGYVSAGLGAGLLITTVVYFIVTDPGSETITIDDQQSTATTYVAPTPDGFTVGRTWSF